MKEENDPDQSEATNTPDAPPGTLDDAPRELFVMRVGRRRVAVFADEVDSVAQDLSWTPLPHAPASVLGVVQMRGRMRTVIDVAPLVAGLVPDEAPEHDSQTTDEALQHDSQTTDPTLRTFVALRGDEQLALAVEQVEEKSSTLALSAAQDVGQARPEARPESLIRALIHGDPAAVVLLDPSHLFETAMRGTERRRPRT